MKKSTTNMLLAEASKSYLQQFDAIALQLHLRQSFNSYNSKGDDIATWQKKLDALKPLRKSLEELGATFKSESELYDDCFRNHTLEYFPSGRTLSNLPYRSSCLLSKKNSTPSQIAPLKQEKTSLSSQQ